MIVISARPEILEPEYADIRPGLACVFCPSDVVGRRVERAARAAGAECRWKDPRSGGWFE